MENSIFTTPTFIYDGKEYPSAVATPNVFDADLLLGQEKLYVEKGWDDEEYINFFVLLTLLNENSTFAVHPGDFHADELYLLALAEQIYLSGEHFKTIIRTRDREKVENCLGVGDTCEGSGDHHGPRADRAHAVCAFSRFVRRCYCTEEIRKQQPPEFWENLGYFANVVALQDTGYLIVDELSFVHRQSVLGTFAEEDRFEKALDMVRLDLEARLRTWIAEIDAEKKAREIIAANPEASVLTFPKETRACDFVKFLIWEQKHPCLYYVSWQGNFDWRLLCAATPKESDADVYDSRSARFLLPEAWAGKRNGDLAKETGIEGAIFCHQDRWIAAWQKCEQTEKAAELAIKILKGEA